MRGFSGPLSLCAGLVYLLLLFAGAPSAHAACAAAPGQQAWPVFYTGGAAVYCADGDDWTSLPGGGGSSFAVMTSTQRDALASPAAGTVIYNSSAARPEFYDGLRWYAFGQAMPVTGGDGISSATAGISCKEIFDGGYAAGDKLYWVDPDAGGPVPAFEAYCDMAGGGWTLVTRQLSTVAAATHETAAAVGTLTGPSQTTAAKYADAIINALAGYSTEPVYRLTCQGRTNYFKLPGGFSATRVTWSPIHVSTLSESSGFHSVTASYPSCSAGPHSCDQTSPSSWGANGGRGPAVLYGARGGFSITHGCGYHDTPAQQGGWASGSGTFWVK